MLFIGMGGLKEKNLSVPLEKKTVELQRKKPGDKRKEVASR